MTSVRAKGKGRLKASTVLIYASIFVLLVVLIGVGYRAPQEVSSVANTVTPITNTEDTQTTVNEVVATTIAASVAEATNLSIASNVANLAVSTQIESELTQSDGSEIAKPQIIELSAATRNITTYKVKNGDTVAGIAAQFGISVNTLKWANDLSSDTLRTGQNLDILPLNGIVYTAKSGDTVTKLASKYKANAARITSYNDLELNGLKPGLKIIIPGGVLPANERPGYSAPTTGYAVGYSSGFSGNTWHIKVGTPMYGGNTYSPGYCTAYAYDRRVELGLPISNQWGHAVTWASSAANQGLTVNRTPTRGAIIQNGGGFGHVAIVEEVLSNGDLRLSEMNAYVAGGGWNIVSGRVLPAAYVGQYLYIH